MINFIIEEEKLKEVIDNYMMNYNYTYDIKIFDSYKENNYFNATKAKGTVALKKELACKIGTSIPNY